MEIKKSRNCVYALEYHLVWCVKYRRKVLTPEIEEDLFRICREYARDNGFTIAGINADMDHVHVLVQAPPTLGVSDMMRGFKGVTARRLFELHPELKKKLWDGHLWNPSYFAATVSENTERQIREYIQSQKEE